MAGAPRLCELDLSANTELCCAAAHGIAAGLAQAAALEALDLSGCRGLQDGVSTPCPPFCPFPLSASILFAKALDLLGFRSLQETARNTFARVLP